jgi:hypothetical protein
MLTNEQKRRVLKKIYKLLDEGGNVLLNLRNEPVTIETPAGAKKMWRDVEIKISGTLPLKEERE